MSTFGLYGKIIAQPGQRDALVAGLLEAAALMQHVPGCELYIVNVSASEPDVVWVTEVWRSVSDHQASLAQEEIKALIKRNMPLIAGGERIELVPIGGKGLPTASCRLRSLRCQGRKQIAARAIVDMSTIGFVTPKAESRASAPYRQRA